MRVQNGVNLLKQMSSKSFLETWHWMIVCYRHSTYSVLYVWLCTVRNTGINQLAQWIGQWSTVACQASRANVLFKSLISNHLYFILNHLTDIIYDFCVTYSITSGIQGKEHPNPGKAYYAVGFPRVCYLPDSPQGRRVLRLLCVAWQRRLIFTVGRSNTTGREDVVTWNDIHHKTEIGPMHSGFGYPDPGYLDRCLDELAAHGVTDCTESNTLYQEVC